MSKNTYTIGIDPGLTGAWVLLKNGRFNFGTNHVVVDNQLDFQSASDCYCDWLEVTDCKAITIGQIYIEKPFTPAKQKGTEMTWRNYQTLYLAFSGYKEVIEISPKEWQKTLGFDKIDKKIKGVERKKMIKERALKFAKQQEPKINWYRVGKKGQTLTTVNDGLVDAYCIAYAGFLLENLK